MYDIITVEEFAALEKGKKVINYSIIDLINQYQEYSKDHKEAETVRYQESHARSWRKFLKLYQIKQTNELNNQTIVLFMKFLKKTCKNITINKRILFIKQVFNHFGIDNRDLYKTPKLRESRLSYEI